MGERKVLSVAWSLRDGVRKLLQELDMVDKYVEVSSHNAKYQCCSKVLSGNE